MTALVAVFGVEGRVGLTIARALGREGVRCFGVSLEGVTYGCARGTSSGSRPCSRQARPTAFRQAVDLFRRVKPDFVMAARSP
jgi:hypothetical protein